MPRELPDLSDPNFDVSSIQDENGIDLTLIDQMLSLTPTERLQTLKQSWEFDRILAQARISYYGSDPTLDETEVGER